MHAARLVIPVVACGLARPGGSVLVLLVEPVCAQRDVRAGPVGKSLEIGDLFPVLPELHGGEGIVVVPDFRDETVFQQGVPDSVYSICTSVVVGSEPAVHVAFIAGMYLVPVVDTELVAGIASRSLVDPVDDRGPVYLVDVVAVRGA